ncbi:DUF3298 and DUF4163 domain-containing protein [Aquimarina sp. AU474]|uniref:DUF3298 and DUF4163 domain-containing protein n=1 Tax=Aquimarina sp. AU474 TaxID=2108529 RepID=UPI000D693FB2|nr:DUF3298 and DUF4163 domain-containing protein [Aquimarina sp. AU474]
MINTKPNTNLKLIFFILIMVGIFSCNTRESLTFEAYHLSTDNLSNCKNIDCALLEINLLRSIKDDQISMTINKEIENTACMLLNVGENESENTIEQAMLEFNRSFIKISNEFNDEIVPYEANINCNINFQCSNLISVLMDSYLFTGGAHGYGAITFINIDPYTGKRFSNQSLFKEFNDFERYTERVFRSKQEILEHESINSTGFFFENDQFALPENIGFTKDQIILHYNSYEISSYAEGPVEIKIPKEDVTPFLAIEIE